MSYDTLLSYLKYIGIVITGISAVWGTISVITKKVRGRQQLTTAGRIAVALIVLGLVVTITSTALQVRADSEVAVKRAAEDFKRTNRIILAGQPLASLQLRWHFPRIKKAILDFVAAAEKKADEEQSEEQGEMDSSQGYSFSNDFVFSPLETVVATGELNNEIQNVIVLLSLDNYHNAVLSFGNLQGPTKWVGKIDETTVNKELSGGVRYPDWRSYEGRTRGIESPPFFRIVDNSIEMSWALDAKTLLNCLDKQIPGISLTANLPAKLKMIILFDIQTLPFVTPNFASSPGYDVWEPEDSGEETPAKELLGASVLSLIPNELPDQTSRYEAKRVQLHVVHESEYGEAREDTCKFLVVEFESVDNH